MNANEIDDKSENVATLNWSLRVNCPKCKEKVDLVAFDNDNDYLVATAIFSNQWDDLVGYEVTCPHCEHEFELTKVEY